MSLTKHDFQQIAEIIDKKLDEKLEPLKKDVTALKQESSDHTELLKHILEKAVHRSELEALEKRVHLLEQS